MRLIADFGGPRRVLSLGVLCASLVLAGCMGDDEVAATGSPFSQALLFHRGVRRRRRLWRDAGRCGEGAGQIPRLAGGASRVQGEGFQSGVRIAIGPETAGMISR